MTGTISTSVCWRKKEMGCSSSRYGSNPRTDFRAIPIEKYPPYLAHDCLDLFLG